MSKIFTPSITSASELSNIAYVSKAHWGYSQEFMEQCRDELTITEQDIESGMVEAVTFDEKIAGFYKLAGEAPIGELSGLYWLRSW